jgi:ATP-dependent Lon protease
MSTTDDSEDIDLPATERDAISTGAAADSADWDERLKGMPRLLRYVMLVSDSAKHIEQRLIAEIDELCPQLPHNVVWTAVPSADTGLALAAELDRRAVAQNEPTLRSLADCVRLLCLPLPHDANHFEDYRRVGKALVQAFRKVEGDAEEQLCCDLERFAFGWAALPACTDLLSKNLPAAVNAIILGANMVERRISATKAAARRRANEEEERRNEEQKAAEAEETVPSPATEAVSDRHRVVVRLSNEEMKNVKLKDILGPLKSVINAALPLVEVPPLHQVRSTLMFEFPYAVEVIDFALADLVGRPTVRLRPLLLVGDPGGGKSRFARRLGEVLGLPNIWREDASRADGAPPESPIRWFSSTKSKNLARAAIMGGCGIASSAFLSPRPMSAIRIPRCRPISICRRSPTWRRPIAWIPCRARSATGCAS